jgi:hypothetical protein
MDLPVQSEDVQVGLETQDIIMPTVNTLWRIALKTQKIRKSCFWELLPIYAQAW